MIDYQHCNSKWTEEGLMVCSKIMKRESDTRLMLKEHTMPAAAAAAKSLQSCPTPCDPTDGSPPGSAIPGILQARALEWAAISFSTTMHSHPQRIEPEFNPVSGSGCHIKGLLSVYLPYF